MEIKKILNNNVVIALDKNGMENVLMGRGIGFGHKTGDQAPEEKIEKRFSLHSNQFSEKLQQLLISIPLAHFLISERIISNAKTILGKALSDSIYITLPDHISATIQRQKEGIALSNPLLWDIRQFYPDEYRAGLDANRIIEDETGVIFSEDEAGFIAMHFVNAELGSEIREVYDMTYLMQESLHIVRDVYGQEPDRDSIDYYRFITHLKFFVQRIVSGQQYGDDEADLLQVVQSKYPKAYTCARKICSYVKQEKGFQSGQNELLYLTIHIARVTEKGKD